MRHLMQLATGVLLAVAAISGRAQAQTTRPVERLWPATVQSAARALQEGDLQTLTPLLSDDLAVRDFAGAGRDLLAVLARTQHGTRIGVHAYLHPPLVMAADLAADFKAFSAAPEALRQSMAPADEAEMKRANATAVQWVESQLQAREGTPVAVMVLWCPPSEGEPAEAMAPVYLLLKGEEADGGVKITSIVFGDPAPQSE